MRTYFSHYTRQSFLGLRADMLLAGGDAMPRWKLYLSCVFLGGLLAAFLPLMQSLHLQTDRDTPVFRQWTYPARQAWFVQLGAFDTEPEALAFAARTQEAGMAGYIWQDTVYRCLGGWFETREIAQSYLDALHAAGWTQACLYHLSRPLTADSGICTLQETNTLLTADQALWDAAIAAAQAAQDQEGGHFALSQSRMRAARICARIGGCDKSEAPLSTSLTRLRFSSVQWVLEALQIPEDLQSSPSPSATPLFILPAVG